VKGGTTPSLPRSIPGRVIRNITRRKTKTVMKRKRMFLFGALCLISLRQSYVYRRSRFPFRRCVIPSMFCSANQINAAIYFYINYM
jgi:hypothetical protein